MVTVASVEPDWVQHALWWQIYPLGFVGAPSDGMVGASQRAGAGHTAHRLRRIIDWLDYAVELGVSGIALGPVFASETHGYDTSDYYRIDPRLGNEDDFVALVEAAHGRGLKLLLDGVFNHVGRSFPAFAQVLAGGPESPAGRMFQLYWPAGATAGTEPDYEHFEGNRNLVTLNHAEPAVADQVTDVMCYWLGRGADGWRLDAAYAVPNEFWAAVLPRVREAHPGAYLVGEVIHGDYDSIIGESRLDSLTQYELWKAIWSSINEANFFELDHALGRHNHLLAEFAPWTFIGNHDVSRIASQITDARHHDHALVLLLTLGGTPAIYYGDEQGFTGIKEDNQHGDDAVRPAMPENGPGGLLPYGWPTYRRYQELIGLRRRHPWLHRAQTTTLQLTNTHLIFSVAAGEDRLVVALNLGDDPVDYELGPATSGNRTDVLVGEAAQQSAGRLRLEPHGWAVLG